LFNAHLFQDIIEILANGDNKKKEEAGFVVMNNTYFGFGAPSHIQFLVEFGVIAFGVLDLIIVDDYFNLKLFYFKLFNKYAHYENALFFKFTYNWDENA